VARRFDGPALHRITASERTTTMAIVAIVGVRCPWSPCCVKFTIVVSTLTDLRAKCNLMFSDPLSRFEQSVAMEW